MFPFLIEKKKKEELNQIPLQIELYDPSLYNEYIKKNKIDEDEKKITIIQL